MNGLTVSTSAFMPTIADTNWEFAGGIVIRPGIPTIRYIYDELGRLIAVVAPGGDAAVYHYDAVGNVLSIDRHASTQVSIVSFSPAKGPIGTQVTIFGTGFSAIIAQNTVTFNGTTATISSATTTQLVVTVPSGATTGTIGVTAPAGSATSAGTFTVASVAAPTITSFTPSLGIAGTAVSVTGTNFDTTPANNRVKVNATLAAVASVTTTTLGTTIPTLTGSGPITIATPLGTAVSATDLFVPPLPYGTADVDYTSRLAMGASQTVTIGPAGKIGLVTFAGTAGQRFSLVASSGTFGAPGGCNLHLSVLKPDTSTLIPDGCMGGSGFIDGTVLPVTGTYTLFLDAGPNTGSVTPFARRSVDVTGRSRPCVEPSGHDYVAGPEHEPDVQRHGRSARHALATSSSFRDCTTFKLGVVKPDGSILANPAPAVQRIHRSGIAAGVGDLYPRVRPDGARDRHGDAHLVRLRPRDRSITPNGSSVPVTIAWPGQNAS